MKTIRHAVTVVLGVVVLAMVAPAAAHVAEVTTSVPLAEVHDSGGLQRAIAKVVDRARTETIAFEPSVVAVTGLRVLGERVLIGLLFADEDGEAMLQDLHGAGRDEGLNPDELDMDRVHGQALRI